jgi:hypothetical protein
MIVEEAKKDFLPDTLLLGIVVIIFLLGMCIMVRIEELDTDSESYANLILRYHSYHFLC